MILKASLYEMPNLVDKDRLFLTFVEENIYVHNKITFGKQAW